MTIPTASVEGCNNAVLVSGCKAYNDDCQALNVDKDGNLLSVSGTCLYAKWDKNSNKWETQKQAQTVKNAGYNMRCFPNSKLKGLNAGQPLFTGVKYNKILDEDGWIRDDICHHALKITDPKIDSHIMMGSPCSDTRLSPDTSTGGTSSRIPCGKHDPKTACKYPINGYYIKDDEIDYNKQCCMDMKKGDTVFSHFMKSWDNLDPKVHYTPQFTSPKNPFKNNPVIKSVKKK